ncbi:helix-turn-helix domain-containing protein [Mucilaginibacter jinjuensis]|uniref:AraC family transcriptional regulator n=1 Tax=Mucilaginibacter jinjuensis TaxID=1176721 RepID=A0ABY7T3P1_9SPHI|nr:AraC family transcriptional regulator [Mucilaginibacter jinjuensis]WCT09907.1 AraC family transcriptional regulator [Mucilaginibacter jinjuensis]
MDKNILMGIEKIAAPFLEKAKQFPFYSVMLITEGSGRYYADIGKFDFEAPVLLFSTPLQSLKVEHNVTLNGYILQFHGDFYCIEYHKARVACNGLLFNNIYIEPSVKLSGNEAAIFEGICQDIENEFNADEHDEVVLRSYLQLFLAKSSSVKLRNMAAEEKEQPKDEQMERFMQLLEQHYMVLHKPTDYANLLAMSPNNFSKRCNRYYGKSPSLMIQERLILEAKKKLHLTRQSIKEIAFALNFSDEFYFSRFFKKFTKVSPQVYREQAGISIVADMASY